MPLYDYRCDACGHVFETEHAMSVRPRIKCVHCGSTRTAKLFNAAGVQFRGSGFYVTDSRTKPDSMTSAKPEAEVSSSSNSAVPSVQASGNES